jgi:hypothetical protein
MWQRPGGNRVKVASTRLARMADRAAAWRLGLVVLVVGGAVVLVVGAAAGGRSPRL